MKALKKMSCLVLAFCLALGVFMVPTTSAEAATKAKVQKTFHMNPDVQSTFTVQYANRGDKIKNLKSKSKDLAVKQTYQSAYGSAGWGDDDFYGVESYNYGYIGLYTKKAGTYKFTFDIYSKAGKKRSSHTVTVKADYTSAISSITFAGTSLQYDTGRGITSKSLYTTKKSGKLSVKMTKGYTLKGIYVETRNKKGNYTEKKVKNNKKITLGVYAYNYESSYTSNTNPDAWVNTWSKNMYATTTIRVVYVDKYTKNETSQYFYIYRNPANK